MSRVIIELPVLIIHITGHLFFQHLHVPAIVAAYLFCGTVQPGGHFTVAFIHAYIIDGCKAQYTQVAESFIKGSVVFYAINKCGYVEFVVYHNLTEGNGFIADSDHTFVFFLGR